jgi:putative ABC transport system substrate-binding protein
MRLSRFLLLIVVALCAPAEAQQPTAKVARIGYLSTSSGAVGIPRIEAFRQGLRELGYIEGKNVNIEYRYAEGRSERLPRIS